MRTYIGLFLVAGALSAALTPLVIRLCRRFSWLDAPGEARKLHLNAVPRLGGAAVVAAFGVTLSAMFLYDNQVTRLFVDITPKVLRILGPALLVAALGAVDDIRGGVRARTKFLVQIVAATLLWSLGFHIDNLTLPGEGSLHIGPILGYVLTVLWIVAVTNAFNFIDGMDGLASGIALCTAVSVMVMALVTGRREVAVVAIPLAGAVAGFLPFNWPPARIFLGDGGSYFLGFVLGALAIMSSMKASTLVSVAVPIALLAIPLLDTVLVVLRRFLRGQPLFEADGEHIHHRLLRIGLKQRVVVLLLYGLTVLLGGAALLAQAVGPLGAVALIPLVFGLMAFLLVRQLGYEEFTEVWDMVRKAVRFQRQVIANQVRIRRFVQDLQSASSPAELFALLESFLAETGFDACHLEIWPAGQVLTTEAQRTQSDPRAEHRTSNIEHRTSNSDPNSEVRSPTSADSNSQFAIRNSKLEESAIRNPQLEESAIRNPQFPLDWHWSSNGQTEYAWDSWRIRVPMRDGDGAHRGYAYLSRRLEKERVLFQVASLLDAFSAHFPARLAAFPPAALSEYLRTVKAANCSDVFTEQ